MPVKPVARRADARDVLDRFRGIFVWGFVAAIIGGLWVYADAERRLGEARQYWPAPAPRPAHARPVLSGRATPAPAIVLGASAPDDAAPAPQQAVTSVDPD